MAGGIEFGDLPRGLPGTPARSGGAPRALWVDPAHLTTPFWSYNSRKVFLGEAGNGDFVGIADNRHLLTVAGSRTGKGVSAIIPNLLTYEGSVLVLDPKGENATATAGRRGQGEGIPAGGMGQDIYVLDPFGTARVEDHYRATFNPVAELDPSAPEFIDDCDAIADALVLSEPGQELNFWNSSARLVLRGMTAWVAAGPRVPRRTLNQVHRYLMLDDKLLREFLAEIAKHESVAQGVPSDAAHFLLGMDPREYGGVMAVVRHNISFLSSKPMRDLFEGDGRRLDPLTWKYGGKSVYLCLPAMRLRRHARFFRLYVNSLLMAVEARKEEPEIPALMILDEMHVLGHVAALETAAGLIAGYGVRIWSIWQDFSQLKSIYGERWETFLGNASVFQAFGLNDLTTLKYVSERLGTSTTLQVSKSETSEEQRAQGFSGESRSLQSTPLLSVDEVAYFFSRQSGNQLIIYPGPGPIFLKRVEYHRHSHFEQLRRPKT